MVEEKPVEEKPITPYTEDWPEYDNGSDAFSMEDSWIDRIGTVEEKS